MNNFTFLKKFFLLVLVSMTLNNVQAQMGLQVAEITTCPDNSTVDVEVRALSWEAVISMQFTMHFDAAVLSFTGTTPGNAVFSQIFFGTGGAPSGAIAASWYDPSPSFEGVTMDDEVVFTVSFDIVGELGDCSPITFDGMPTLVEFTHDVDGQVMEFTPAFVEGNVCLQVPSVGSLAGGPEMNGDATGYLDLIVTGGTAPYSFLWSNGGTTSNISNLAAGDYSCMVTDASGCSDDLGPFSVENEITESVNTIAGLTDLTLMPNPATDYVNLSVDFDKAHASTIKIYSIIGQVVYNHTVDAQAFNLQIPLADLVNGTYFLELTTETGKAVEKLIVTK